MNNKQHKRATSNLKMLKIIARRLGALNNEVVYLGGCTTALFISDPLSLDVRSTLDVDCIIDVISLGKYYQFENKLKKRGFSQSIENTVMCRWHYDDMILDVMPADEKILGWGNHWFREAIKHTIIHKIADDLNIKSVTAPYFLATKIEAFKARGNNDFLGSHDLEDIIAVIAGRVEIADEVTATSDKLKTHLKLVFGDMLMNDQFVQSLPGHVSDGPVTMQRVQTVIERIKKISR